MINEQDYSFSLQRQPGEFFDWTTFLVTVMLMAAGLISIYSATYDSGMSAYFFKQLVYTGIGTAIMFTLMFIPERWIYANAYVIYGICIAMLLVVLVPGIGKVTYGTRGWINLGGFSLQPSEFGKLGALLAAAKYLSMKGTDIKTLRDLGIVTGLVAVPMLLILVEPDTGSASVLGALLLGILFWSGFDIFILFFVISLPVLFILSLLGNIHFIVSVTIFAIIAASFRRRIAITAGAIIIAVGVGYSSPILVDKLMHHQKDRIETFLKPDADPRGKGYNVIQAILAVGSGGFSGKGFLQGTQTQLRYIPKQWTDFIFCVPTEEFGFIGGLIVIGLIAGVMLRAINIASESDNKFQSMIAFGTASVFFYHAFINIGMAIGVMPVMGIPLPFLSAGGSSLLVNMSLVGLMMNSYRTHRKKKKI